MKKLFTLALALGVLALGAAFAADKAKGGVALTGEVVDLCCYMKMADKKPSEITCAKDCIKKGAPVGILDSKSKTLYLAMGSDDATANEMLADYAGQEITVKGSFVERQGLKAFRLDSVVPVATRSNMGFKEGAVETK